MSKNKGNMDMQWYDGQSILDVKKILIYELYFDYMTSKCS